MEAQIRLDGVSIHEGYYLARWNNSTEIPEEITQCSFTSNKKPLTLQCQVRASFRVYIYVYYVSLSFLSYKAHKVGADLKFPRRLAHRWLSPPSGQDISLSLETFPVKLVPTYTWVE